MVPITRSIYLGPASAQRIAMHSASRRSVCLSECPSQAGSVPCRDKLNVGFHHCVAHGLCLDQISYGWL